MSTDPAAAPRRHRRHRRRRPPTSRTGPACTRFAAHRRRRRPRRSYARSPASSTSAAADGERRRRRRQERFCRRYLTGFIFWLSLPLGGDGPADDPLPGEDVVGPAAPRPLEAATRTLPLMVVLFLPVVVGVVACTSISPYWWTHPDDAHAPRGRPRAAEPPAAEPRQARAADRRPARTMIARGGRRTSGRTATKGNFGFLSPPGVHRRRRRAVRDLGHADLLPQQVGARTRRTRRPREGGAAAWRSCRTSPARG